MKNKILKGREIVLLILDGKAPKKIKLLENNTIWDFDEKTNSFSINLLFRLDDEFEIIEESKVWKPKEGGEYWYLNDDGGIILTKWKYSIIDYLRYDIGNCFKTKEEAEKTLEKIKIYMQLKRYAEEHNTEKIDWNNKKQCKWAICYDYELKLFFSSETCVLGDIGQIYFTNEELAEQAIKEIGEDNIIKLFEED